MSLTAKRSPDMDQVGLVGRLPDDLVAAARRTVARNATDAEDLAHLLELLGIGVES